MAVSKDQMIELLAENHLSFSKVAYALNMTPQAVKQQARRMGIVITKSITHIEPSAKRKKYT